MTHLQKLRQISITDAQMYSAAYLALGATHSVVITEDGSVYTAGTSSHGELGFKPNEKNGAQQLAYSPSKQQIPLTDTEFIDKNFYFHRVDAFGKDSKAVQASCGERFTLVLNSEGVVFGFGRQIGKDICYFQPQVHRPFSPSCFLPPHSTQICMACALLADRIIFMTLARRYSIV